MFTPLDQFDITNIISFPLNDIINISFTNSGLFGFLSFFLILLLLTHLYERQALIPNKYQFVVENLFSFVRSLVTENIGKVGLVYLPYIFLIMVFVLLCNFIGLIPYTFTVTSHLSVTFFLAFMTFFGLNIIGINLHGREMLSLFLPNGAPLVIAPFLILIEIISYIARVFSLSIRLFANMMSGHTLLKILAGFSWNLFCMGSVGSIIFLIPALIVFSVTGLESAIAFLQAYVFTILICLYLHDAIALH